MIVLHFNTQGEVIFECIDDKRNLFYILVGKRKIFLSILMASDILGVVTPSRRSENGE
jgi:hypothetical protein